MKTLRITDIEGNLVIRTEIDTQGDNFSWTPQSGSCIILGGVSLTENPEIPYTVAEARMAAEKNDMDIYHKELILWLCNKVDEHAFKCPSCDGNFKHSCGCPNAKI